MLLGIPGDNTYSNYAEANRAFYRQTVVPLLARIATALGHWLGESFGGSLRLVPDLDEIPGLSLEREALWKRLGEASFLTDDEKRAAVGYEPLPVSSLSTLLAKYDSNQPRVPAGSSDGGQWTSGGGSGASGGEESDQELLPGNAIPAANITIENSAVTGDPRIDQTSVQFGELLSRVADRVGPLPELSPQAYGSRIHAEFARAVREERISGIGFFDVEQSWGFEPDVRYGAPLSVRTDVVLRGESGEIIAIYDVKTGYDDISPRRRRELHEKTRTGSDVPIIIIRARRVTVPY